MRFPAIYLLHGIRGSPEGSVKKIQDAIEPQNRGVKFVRPLLPHHDPKSPPEKSVEFLKKLQIPQDSLLIGVSLGGLAAAKLQEESRPDLHVICISSATMFGELKLNRKMAKRVSFYSSSDEVIADRVNNWPQLSESYDLPWLTHDTDTHLDKLAELIQKYIFQ